MNICKTALLAAATLFSAAGLSQASLTSFTDYGYIGGNTISWDYFYGANYQPSWNFVSGSAGNPSDSSIPLTLNANVVGWQAGPPSPASGQATGPLDSDGATKQGDSNLFYTFFSSDVHFTITGTVASGTLNTFSLQALLGEGGGGFSSVSLNGGSADDADFTLLPSSSVAGTYYWTWENLNLSAGDTFTLSFDTVNQHSLVDAVQIQTDAQVVPEPSTYLLIVAGLTVVLYAAKRRRLAASL